MRLPYLHWNDPWERKLVPLFHTWGDLLLSRHMAHESRDCWMEGLATRWTIQTAWACFELTCHLALGLNPSDPAQKLSPGFWVNLNRRLSQRTPPLDPIDHKVPPWDDLHFIQEERHPFAHLGAGGGRFPTKAAANLAAEEAEKAIRRFLSMLGFGVPNWITIAGISWPRDGDPFRSNFGGDSSFGVGGSLTPQNASESDPDTLRVAIVHLDGSESCSLYPARFDWKPLVEQMLQVLGTPIKGVRVYDKKQVYLDEPLVMWGGVERLPEESH